MHKKGFFFSFEIMLNIHIDILSFFKKITNNNKAMGFKLWSSLFMWYRWCRYSAEVSPDKSSAINEEEQVNHCGKYKEK